MKELWESGKIRILLSVLLVLVMLSMFTRNVENNVISTSVNTMTHGLSKVSAAVTGKSSDNMSYDELKSEYEKVLEANRQLRARLVDYYDVKEENARLWKFYELKKEHPDYELVPATVLRRDSNDEFYSFTIDKGTTSDISGGDPVIGETGLVGYVFEADAGTAKVVTILSPQSGIGAVDKATDDTGIITGSARFADDNRTMFAKLSSGHQVQEGDIITTTGISGIYPRDLVIGEVKDIGYDTYDTSYYAVVEPYEDLRSIQDIAVITGYDGQGVILRRTAE